MGRRIECPAAGPFPVALTGRLPFGPVEGRPVRHADGERPPL